MADEERFDAETAYLALAERMDALAAAIQQVHDAMQAQAEQHDHVHDRQLEMVYRQIERRS